MAVSPVLVMDVYVQDWQISGLVRPPGAGWGARLQALAAFEAGAPRTPGPWRDFGPGHGNSGVSETIQARRTSTPRPDKTEQAAVSRQSLVNPPASWW